MVSGFIDVGREGIRTWDTNTGEEGLFGALNYFNRFCVY